MLCERSKVRHHRERVLLRDQYEMDEMGNDDLVKFVGRYFWMGYRCFECLSTLRRTHAGIDEREPFAVFE